MQLIRLFFSSLLLSDILTLRNSTCCRYNKEGCAAKCEFPIFCFLSLQEAAIRVSNWCLWIERNIAIFRRCSRHANRQIFLFCVTYANLTITLLCVVCLFRFYDVFLVRLLRLPAISACFQMYTRSCGFEFYRAVSVSRFMTFVWRIGLPPGNNVSRGL
jgi:hypothetical protein